MWQEDKEELAGDDCKTIGFVVSCLMRLCPVLYSDSVKVGHFETGGKGKWN